MHTVCATVGLVAVEKYRQWWRVYWHSYYAVSRRITALARDARLHDQTGEILSAIQVDLWSLVSKTRPAELHRLLADRHEVIAGTVAVRRQPDGKVTLQELLFPIGCSPDGGPVLQEPTCTVHVPDEVPRGRFIFNVGECDDKALAQLRPDMPDDAVLSALDRIFASAPAETGGPIDCCAIETAGVRWLRRK